jgi:membrane-associated phospholipid phosphatase
MRAKVPALRPRPGGAESPVPGSCTTGRAHWIISCVKAPPDEVSEPVDVNQQRVERVLEESLERVQTPEAAHAIVARVERLSHGKTEQQTGRAAAHDAPPSVDDQERAAAESIEHAAERPTTESALAAALATTAAQSVAPTPAAPKVVEAAQAALTPHAAVSAEAERGRKLLKDATLHRMSPLQALDARLYLALNEGPHPGWLDSLAWALAIITVGGWIWVVGTLLAYLLRVPRSLGAFTTLLPSVVGATWLVEYPIKGYFRRRRPFVEIVRALVIGKKPGSWSFPSGHTAASFASACVLSTVWPRRAPLFAGLAATVGVSRIYVGAHYPGDVLSGAIAGTVLSEVIRRIVRRLLT